MKKGMLRSAVALTLLGAVAVPMGVHALVPYAESSLEFRYENSFDWTNSSNFDSDHYLDVY